jgi:DNA-directed RNA polymerase subunit L
MEIETTIKEKNSLELKIDNLTVAEIVKSYLNKQGIEFAAWRREHPTKPIIFKIKSQKPIKKEIAGSISEIKKDLDKILSSTKKA